MNKQEQTRKCLEVLKRLGMDMTTLSSLNLSGTEQQLMQGAFSYIDHIRTRLNGVLHGKELEDELELEKKNEEQKRSRSMRR